MNISVIGGDSRIIELVKLLEKDHAIELCGLEKAEDLNELNHTDNLEKTLQKADLVITSIPLSKDGKYVNSAYSDKKILIEHIFKNAKNKKIITGNITKEIQELINNTEKSNEVIDILKLEELTVLNAIPTAEGAIQIAMEESKITIHNSKCLILGFGRIGKILAKMLRGIGANVYCEARKQQDISWINAYGYNQILLTDLDKYLNEFDFIFNTIPYIILDKDKLSKIKKECVLIDLASKPGGIDFEEAQKLNLKTNWALALPGKVAPKTAAFYISEIIKNIE